MGAARTLTAEQRKERARKASASRTTPDYYIRKLVDRAPELTDEQLDKLAALLRRR